MTTATRTHTYITLANPYLCCDQCHQPVPSWHDPQQCGCGQPGFQNQPCGHQAAIFSACLSWGPVDGCQCGPTGHMVWSHCPDCEGTGGYADTSGTRVECDECQGQGGWMGWSVP